MVNYENKKLHDYAISNINFIYKGRINEGKTDAIVKPLCFIVLKLNYIRNKVLMLYNVQVITQSLIKTFWENFECNFEMEHKHMFYEIS